MSLNDYMIDDFMGKSALLVYNPGSGKSQLSKDDLLERIYLNLKDYQVKIFEVVGEKISHRLSKILRKLKPDLLIIAGGDGTVKLTTNCLRTRIPIAILPLGSANGLAQCLGIKNLEDGLESLRSLAILAIDAILINDETCLHLADFGSNASMIKRFEEGRSRGMIGYIKSSISEIFESTSCRFRLKYDSETIDLEAKMLVIANGEEYGTGAVINTEGKIDDGKFEIIAVEFKNAGDLISITKGLVTGEHQEQPAVKTWSMKACTIQNLDLANFQIDGELRGNPESVRVRIKKKAFDFVVKF